MSVFFKWYRFCKRRTALYIDTTRGDLLVKLLALNAIDSREILDRTGEFWGNSSYLAFDRVVLSTTAGRTTIIEESAALMPEGQKGALFHGGAGVDNVTGSSGDDYIDGRGGDDVLNGGAGDDILIGGAGEDDLNGGAGNDTLIGGMGKDIYRDSFGFDKISYAGDPNAIKVEARTITDGYGDVDNYGWIEQINGASFDIDCSNDNTQHNLRRVA